MNESIQSLRPYLASAVIFTVLLVLLLPTAVHAYRNATQPRDKALPPMVFQIMCCGILLFLFAMELTDKLFRAFEIGLVIGVGEMELSHWALYFIDAQRPLLFILGLAFAYFMSFFISLFRHITHARMRTWTSPHSSPPASKEVRNPD